MCNPRMDKGKNLRCVGSGSPARSGVMGEKKIVTQKKRNSLVYWLS